MTTPERRQNSSQDQTTDFKDKLGNPIPADAFENDSGPPRELALSKDGRAQFDEETAALAAAAKKIKRSGSAS